MSHVGAALRIGLAPFVVAVGVSAATTQATNVARPALSGAWVLTDAFAGGGKIADQVEVVQGAGFERPGTGATDGAGTGVTGGRGGFTPAKPEPPLGHLPVGFSDVGERLSSLKPKRLSASEALRQELLTPPEELSLSLTNDVVIIGDGIGAAVSYKINGKSESHQLVNGSVSTKTRWDGNVLRQEIDGGRNSDFIRLFELSDDGQTLRVSMGPKSSASDWSVGISPSGSGATDRASAPRRSLYRRKVS